MCGSADHRNHKVIQSSSAGLRWNDQEWARLGHNMDTISLPTLPLTLKTVVMDGQVWEEQRQLMRGRSPARHDPCRALHSSLCILSFGISILQIELLLGQESLRSIDVEVSNHGHSPDGGVGRSLPRIGSGCGW